MEEREAALDQGLSWREYQQLDFYEKADVVAVFRIQKLLELVRSDVAAKAQEAEAKKAAANAKRR